MINRTFLQAFILSILIISCSNRQNPQRTEQATSFSPAHTQLAAPTIDSGLRFHSVIRTFFEDSQGNLWIGSHEEGVCKYDGKRFVYYGKEQGLADNQIRYIQEDQFGNIWFGTGNGIAKFDGKTFEIIQAKPKKEPPLSTPESNFPPNNPKQVWQQQLQEMWFDAGNGNGAYRYDETEKRLVHLRIPPPPNYPDFGPDGYLAGHGYDLYAVYGIYKDNNGFIWFGTPGGGLFRYDGQNFENILEQDTAGVVRTIFQDKSGKIWFGNNGIGLYYYDRTKLVNFTKEKGLENTGIGGAFGIVEDQNGRIWFGTFDAGLWSYDPSKDSGGNLLSSEASGLLHYGSTSKLGTNKIGTVYKDRKEQIWVGTRAGKVFVWDGKDFKPFG